MLRIIPMTKKEIEDEKEEINKIIESQPNCVYFDVVTIYELTKKGKTKKIGRNLADGKR